MNNNQLPINYIRCYILGGFKRQNKMSLLYKPKEEQTLSVEIKYTCTDGKIHIDFSSDCGKFGTDEMLCGWVLTPERLMQILDEREDITDDEL